MNNRKQQAVSVQHVKCIDHSSPKYCIISMYQKHSGEMYQLIFNSERKKLICWPPLCFDSFVGN